MGQMAQTWKPWPLAPLPPGPGLTWSQLEEEPTLVSGSIEATARASDATIVPSLEASTSALSRNFSIGNHPSGSFLLVHTLLTHNQIKHTRRTLHPPSTHPPQPLSFTSANGETSNWREGHARRRHELQNTHSAPPAAQPFTGS